MSYEGYIEHLCEHGHYWVVDAYNDVHKYCTECFLQGRAQTKSVWSHTVDETNGIEYDEHGKALEYSIPYPLEIDHFEDRAIKVPIYKVPNP